MKKITSLLLAVGMVMSMAACGSSTSTATSTSSAAADTSSDSTAASDAGSEENLGYEYGEHFHSDEPVTYTMFFNDNPAYPMKDTWQTEGIFKAIEDATNVHLELTIVDNSNYSDKVSLAVSSGTAPYIIPKIYSETAYVTGGGVVPVSDYTQYMPNYTKFVEDYSMQSDLDTITQADGKYYRLPGLKETALQDYTFVVRKDIFDAAGYDVTTLEDDWTWDEFADVLIGVKKYMVEQGMCSDSDYIWSDMWCGQTSGYGQGGNLLKLLGASYGINTGWAITTNYGLVFDWDKDEFVSGSISDNYKQAYTVLQKLVQNKILDPETWTQDDDTALNKFYRGETVIMSTNRAQYATQASKIEEQLGAGNFELYRILVPVGTDNYQAENQRLECGVMISANALKELGEDEFIKMMRFVDWLWYSDEGLTLTKWGIEGETYTVDNGTYSLTPGYYCNGLSIAKTSDDQIDLREELGYACGNFMYGGNAALLTSNFSADLQDFYDRMAKYRELRPLDPTVTLDEDQLEMANLWGTPLTDTINAWTCKFAMNQADINNDWDAYVADVQAQNLQNVIDLYNEVYQASK